MNNVNIAKCSVSLLAGAVNLFAVLIFLFFGILLIAILIYLYMLLHRLSATRINTREYQQKINLIVYDYLKKSNFQISKVFYLNDNATYKQQIGCKKFIAVDNENKQICLVNYANGSILIVKFNEILNYEIYENGGTYISGGNIGGLWAGFLGATVKRKSKELKLIIRLKKYDISNVTYEIIANTSFNSGINKSKQAYRECISTLQEVVSFLEVVTSENNSDTK